MKECPICHGTCFDDMEVCYGCMHRFVKGLSMQAHEREKEEIGPKDGEVIEPRSEESFAPPRDQVPAISEPQSCGTAFGVASDTHSAAEQSEEHGTQDDSPVSGNPFATTPAVTIHGTSATGAPMRIVLLAMQDVESFTIPQAR